MDVNEGTLGTCFEAQLLNKLSKGWSDSTAYKMLALHEADSYDPVTHQE